MACLLHEKPFAGVNGSGKHVNFSIGNNNQGNLLNPGDTPHENAQFLVFCAAVIRAVHHYGGLLRAVVASARNDFRLGANEAPPAIISIFLGEQLMDVFDQIAKGGATGSKESGILHVGVDTLPPMNADPGDRNRTSPFAFTGNRFEFRAPGSGAVDLRADGRDQHDPGRGDGLHRHRDRGLARRRHGVQRRRAEDPRGRSSSITARRSSTGTATAEEWQQEAAARGLLNLRTTVDALPQLAEPAIVERPREVQGASRRELASRLEVYLEQYILSVHVEAKETAEMAKTTILPAAQRYLGELAGVAAEPQGRRSAVRRRHAERRSRGWSPT